MLLYHLHDLQLAAHVVVHAVLSSRTHTLHCQLQVVQDGLKMVEIHGVSL